MEPAFGAEARLELPVEARRARARQVNLNRVEGSPPGEVGPRTRELKPTQFRPLVHPELTPRSLHPQSLLLQLQHQGPEPPVHPVPCTR